MPSNGLLSDNEIVSLVADKYIVGLSGPVTFGKDDQIQPASIDLRIGKIFVPEEYEADGEPKVEVKFCLTQGHTVLLETKEQLDFPADVAGIGFPPARVSGQGILMTNPGHVDPGYKGHMRFTVINMGRKPYELREGDSIVTLLLFRLSSPATRDWRVRREGQFGVSSTKATLDRLSVDFLDVTSRAEAAARKQSAVIGVISAIATAVLGGAAVIGASLISRSLPSKEEFDKLGKDVSRIEQKLNVNDLTRRIEKIEEQGRLNQALMGKNLTATHSPLNKPRTK